jgi:hypothetical protein
LDDEQKALDAAKARRKRAVQGAFDKAEKDHWMLKVKKDVTKKLLSRSPEKTAMERLKKSKTPLRPTGLTRSSSRAAKATDSVGLHRATCARRRDKTLSSLNEFVAWAGPIHLPGVDCPPESDTKAHNNYKAKVRACVRARPVMVSSRVGRAGDPRERRQLLEGRNAAHSQGSH